MLASTVLGGLALMASAPASAQTPAGADGEVGEVVVTGSRIRRVETTTEAPVTVLTAQALEDRGFIQAGQALNELTANMPQFAQASGSGSAAGTGQQFPSRDVVRLFHAPASAG